MAKFKIIMYCRRDGRDFVSLSGDPGEDAWVIVGNGRFGFYATNGGTFLRVNPPRGRICVTPGGLASVPDGWTTALSYHVPSYEVIALKQILEGLL